MIHQRTPRTTVAVLVSVLGVATWAEDLSPTDEAALASRLRHQGVILPLEHVTRQARRLCPGILIDVDLHYEEEHQGYVYAIEMLDPAGRVRALELDATNGDLIEVEGGRD